MGNKYFRQELDIKKVIEMYQKGMTQIEIANQLGTTQKVIHQRLKEVGFKCRIAKKRNQFGENNDSWKGDKAGYKALHYRIYKLRGNPHKCEVCGSIKKQKYEWANLTGNFNNTEDYKRMCCSCHAKYDNKIRNITK